MAYLTQLQSTSLSNQNITSALLLATFTNTTRLRKIFIDVFADQIAGNGNYVVYATRQRSGSGSAYEVGARTTVAVPSGVTSQAFPTIALMCGATDVIKVYLVGLAGDTTTPDTIVEFSEEFVLTDASGYTQADVQLWKGSTAPAMTGDAYARLGAPAGASVSADIAALPTASEIDTELSSSHGSGAWGSGGNGGALSLTYTLTSTADSSAIQGAIVELYAEISMTTLIDSKVTDALGQCTFSNLVAGTYYLKRIKSGWSFTNPDSEVVS